LFSLLKSSVRRRFGKIKLFFPSDKLADVSKPARAHCLTIQNPIQDPDWSFLAILTGGKLRCAVWQLEAAPTTGQLHFQAYVEWNKPVRGSVFRSFAADPADFPFEDQSTWCSGIHVEPRRASREAARQYCEVAEWKGESKGKLDGPWYWPSLEAWGSGGQGYRSDLAAACAIIQSGGSLYDVAVASPATFVRYERGLDRLSFILSPSEFRECVGIFLWGATGVGKSHWVYSTFGAANVYPVASEAPLWLDGYTGQSILFFEEFDSAVPIKTLLRIVDGYPLLVPVKGGFRHSRWTRVIFTGNSDVTATWPPELIRRFTADGVRHIYHVGMRNGVRTGFPSPASVGGRGGFPVIRRPHALPAPPGGAVAQYPELPLAPPPIPAPANVDDPSVVSISDVIHEVAPKGVRILPSFVRAPDTYVHHAPLCSNTNCGLCLLDDLI